MRQALFPMCMPVPDSFIEATGGIITTDGDYKIHTFNSSGTFEILSLGYGHTEANTLDYLVVAGGGAGGAWTGAGGGAGGMLTATGHTVSAQVYPITVGAGGVGTTTNADNPSGDGGNSVFDTVTSIGGGGGGANSVVGRDGGSGGGNGYGPAHTDVSVGTVGQGNGSTIAPALYAAPNYGAGGGGGKNAAGLSGTSTTGGNGGDGLSSSISGTPVTYAGGGGGGTYAGGTVGAGGAGGGGNAAPSNTAAKGSDGAANTGGGGGGSCNNYAGVSASGGSGVVIIKYRFQ